MNRLLLSLLTAVTLTLLVSSSPVFGQGSVRTLTIHDDTVYVDGKALSQSELPSSLDVSGVEAQYRFLGIDRPVLELGGQLYAVTDRLEPVSEDEVRRRNASVILRGSQQAAAGVQQASAGDRAQTPRGSREAATAEASEMEAARQAYLREMQERSETLYRQLVRERRMEAETRDLARIIRLLPDGPERDAQIDTLRSMLNRTFDLKQENRRREIERLQRQIDELQRRLEMREAMREEMIEERMEYLIGGEEEK
jgi:hypothetical protein